jgi:hypothetical protein
MHLISSQSSHNHQLRFARFSEDVSELITFCLPSCRCAEGYFDQLLSGALRSLRPLLERQQRIVPIALKDERGSMF